MFSSLLLLSLIAFLQTFFLTYLFNKKSFLIDRPNNRSSHVSDVPTSGGLSIVTTSLCFFFYLIRYESFNQDIIISLILGSFLIAILGLWDDFKNISAKIRISAHFIIVSTLLFYLYNQLDIFSINFLDEKIIIVLLVLYLVWFINFYNFMDGINGLASIQAITVLASAALLILIFYGDPFYIIPLSIAFAVIGFLPFNFPRARIFMGDSSACFLGLTIGLISLFSFNIDYKLFVCFLILMSIFITDATLTLFKRILRKDKFYEAHRSHVYQLAAIRYNSHTKISIFVGIFNILWLLPISFLVLSNVLSIVLAMLLSYLPLLLIFIFFSLKTSRG